MFVYFSEPVLPIDVNESASNDDSPPEEAADSAESEGNSSAAEAVASASSRADAIKGIVLENIQRAQKRQKRNFDKNCAEVPVSNLFQPSKYLFYSFFCGYRRNSLLANKSSKRISDEMTGKEGR
jgi:hypothetical protein